MELSPLVLRRVLVNSAAAHFLEILYKLELLPVDTIRIVDKTR